MAATEQKDKPKGIEFYGGYEVYSESGMDLTMLCENLRLSVEERWRKSQRALAFALTLQQSERSPNECTLPSDWLLSTSEAIAFLKLLATHHVHYVIVGVQAMHAHGSTLMTEEIDICYQRTPTNLEALVTAFTSIHPRLRGAPSEFSLHLEAPTLSTGMNFPLVTDCGYINLWGEVSGIGNYDQVLAQSVEKTGNGLPVRILSVDGLITAKKAAGRNKDKLHLLELIELKKMRDADKPNRPTEETP